LVDDSENVDIREIEQRNGAILIEVRVAPNDVGRLSGSRGKRYAPCDHWPESQGQKRIVVTSWKSSSDPNDRRGLE
jgi:hypothetical protein